MRSKKLDKKNVAKYIKIGSRCPYCNSDNLNVEVAKSDYDGVRIYQNVSCCDCEKGWTDIYQLIGIHINDDEATEIIP